MGPIGIFDSGYGGLTVFKEIVKKLPQYDYIYLGDNARVPYGTRSFETVYEYTLQCVEQLFSLGSHMVVLACNTASAKALRSIQQNDLPNYTDLRKVLGVIRPTAEIVGSYSQSKQVGILATNGTVKSESYVLEIHKFFPEARVFQQACPIWVPLVESNEINNAGTEYFVEKSIKALLAQSGAIDTIILACTHYPILLPLIKKYTPPHIRIISQGPLVADSFADYLYRHPEVEELCSKNGNRKFYSTDDATNFEEKAAIFYGIPVSATQLKVDC
ncbi:glutamate racemase [bacterium A37T11]|nr:glutamate racemase [bacterium A37T11]